MITPRQAATRVKRGVALLDRVQPQWVGRINLAKFNLNDPDQCVLGQVYGSFFFSLQTIAQKAVEGALQKALKNLGVQLTEDSNDRLSEVVRDDIEIDAAHFGFNVADDDYDSYSIESENEAFELLGQQWVKVITRRKTEFKDASRFAA